MAPKGSAKKASAGTAMVYSVIVPAYKEGKNLGPLTTRVFAALKAEGMDGTTEMIIVDDNSKDDSEAVVNKLKGEGYNVRIMIRTTERGLSSAVLAGFDAAEGEHLLCMDADLQHPPEKVPDLLKTMRDGNQYVIGTRYGEGVAIDASWPLHRQIISKGARMLALVSVAFIFSSPRVSLWLSHIISSLFVFHTFSVLHSVLFCSFAIVLHSLCDRRVSPLLVIP